MARTKQTARKSTGGGVFVEPQSTVHFPSFGDDSGGKSAADLLIEHGEQFLAHELLQQHSLLDQTVVQGCTESYLLSGDWDDFLDSITRLIYSNNVSSSSKLIQSNSVSTRNSVIEILVGNGHGELVPDLVEIDDFILSAVLDVYQLSGDVDDFVDSCHRLSTIAWTTALEQQLDRHDLSGLLKTEAEIASIWKRQQQILATKQKQFQSWLARPKKVETSSDNNIMDAAKHLKPVESTKTSAKLLCMNDWVEENPTFHHLIDESIRPEKVAAFDMDGTLIKTKSGAKFSRNCGDWDWLFDPEVPDKLRELHASGFTLLIVTNQAGVAKGKTQLADIKKKIVAMQERLGVPVQAMVSCDTDKWRKPSSAMWDFFTAHCGSSVSQSFFVGDAAGRDKDFGDSDLKFSVNCGMPFLQPEELFLQRPAQPTRANLQQARDLYRKYCRQSNNELTWTDAALKAKFGSPPQNLVVLVGQPAAGKSTFARRLARVTGHSIVNRDTLKTKQACVKMAAQKLDAGANCVIDNTNPSEDSRREYIALASDRRIPVFVVLVDTPDELARHLNIFFSLATAGKTQVTVENGELRGFTGPWPWDNIRSFLGVPFAKPPVGDRRFLPPEPYTETWTEPYDATEFGASCYQSPNFINGPFSTYSDDIDVPLPVMVFIYGGSWIHGSSSFVLYDGRRVLDLAEKPVIIVTLNYRVGPFGFMGSREMQRVAKDGSTGNAGLQDQRMALQWVRRNIEAFGGDKNRITAWGESAGAGSISNHLVMPRSAGLFDQAIIESGPVAHWIAHNLSATEFFYNKVMDHVGCTGYGFRCLQQAAGPDILSTPGLKHAPGYWPGWSPTIDGVEIPKNPQLLAAEGKFANSGPVLLGTNHDEGTLLQRVFFGVTPEFTAAQFKALVEKSFPEDPTGLFQLYPLSNFPDPYWAFSSIVTDDGMTCPAQRTASWLTAQSIPTYLYFFTHEIEALKLVYPWLGVFHASELIFIWDIKSFYDVPLPLTEAERRLQSTFINMWTNFAATGNPNQGPSTSPPLTWPPWSNTTKETFQIDEQLNVISFNRNKYCIFDNKWYRKV